MIGEIGGGAEEAAAEYLKEHNTGPDAKVLDVFFLQIFSKREFSQLLDSLQGSQHHQEEEWDTPVLLFLVVKVQPNQKLEQ